MKDHRVKARSILRHVQMPGRYVGGEWNAVVKNPARLSYRIALCYPDVYEVGMSHQGLAILYHIVNEAEDQCAERCYAPWPDMAARMRANGIPLYTLETGTALREFDLVGFSLQHELLATNVLHMLDLAGIPLRGEERGPEDPIVVAGGSGAYAPEPLAEAFDLFLPGDGEAALPRLAVLFKKLKAAGAARSDMLEEAAGSLPFAYAPAFYQPRYQDDGRFRGLERRWDRAPEIIRPAVVEDLDQAPLPCAPVQPGIRCVHDRITLEIMRGCTRGCRFCQAGMIKRPLRIRSPESLLETAKKSYAQTGCDEISLTSLSTSDYPGLTRLMRMANEHFETLRVGLSLPSLRIGDRLKEIPGLAGAVRKAGLTLAPEAATDRLRRGMNKEITNEDLEEGVLRAFELGWRQVKLYFMIGLPGETEEDVRAIGRLARRISDLRKRVNRGPALVNVSVSTFVPKPHTPFQWSPMARFDEIREKQKLLYGARLPRRIRFRFHDARMSFVEGMLARGDRRAFAAIERAYRYGALFDAWKDRFAFSLWERAFQEEDLDPEVHLYREREDEEAFPWDHIHPGPSRAFLANEYRRAGKGEPTPYCEGLQCNSCGIDPFLCARLKREREKS